MPVLFILLNQIILIKMVIKVLRVETKVKAHNKYLKKIGFTETPIGSGNYIKNI